MKISQFLVLLSVPIFLAGCGSYGITYNTVPQGASLICKGQHEGYTPTTLNYDVDSDSKKRGYFSTAPCKARWVSGAQKDYGNFWDLEEFPDGVMQTLQRPNDENYSQDAEFALKVQGVRYQQQAAKNSADAANAARSAESAINQMKTQLNTPKFILPPPVPITFGPPSPWRSY
jgi:hypothetical protein